MTNLFRRAFGFTLALALVISTACNNDDGERLSGKIEVTTITTGTFDPAHEYLLTFSELVGIQDYPNGVRIGPNVSAALDLPRVGEVLWVYISDVPTSCPGISSASSTGNQLAFQPNPTDPDHPEAQYGSSFLVPLNGSVGTLSFTIACN